MDGLICYDFNAGKNATTYHWYGIVDSCQTWVQPLVSSKWRAWKL